MGTNLPGNREHIPTGQVDGVQNPFLGYYRKAIGISGQPGNVKEKAVKPFPVIFVRILRQVHKLPSDCDLIDDMFHSTTPNFRCMEHSMCLNAEQNFIGVKAQQLIFFLTVFHR